MYSKLLEIEKNNIKWFPYLYSTLASIFLVLLQVCMKEISMYINPSFAIAFRCFGVMMICFLLLLLQGEQINVKDPKLFRILIARSFMGVLNFIFVTLAVTLLPIAIVNSLYNLGPILIFFIEAFHLNKKINRLQIIFTIICFIGVLLIIKPQFLFPSQNPQIENDQKYSVMEKNIFQEGEKNNMQTKKMVQQNDTQSYNRFHLILPFCSAIVFSYAMFFLHELKGKMSNNIILFHLFLCQTLVGGMQLNFTSIEIKKQFDGRLFVIVLFLFCVSYFMQIFLTRATMYKPASSTMPFGYSGIIFSLAIDIMVYNSSFDIYSIFGIFLTSAGLLSKIFSS